MRTIDTRGQQCPAPIIAIKKTLKETKTGEAFKVLTDSQTTLNNLIRFLKDNKTEFSVEESAGVWTLTIKWEPEMMSLVIY
jgi:TusA-related sulfurtransferase